MHSSTGSVHRIGLLVICISCGQLLRNPNTVEFVHDSRRSIPIVKSTSLTCLGSRIWVYERSTRTVVASRALGEIASVYVKPRVEDNCYTKISYVALLVPERGRIVAHMTAKTRL